MRKGKKGKERKGKEKKKRERTQIYPWHSPPHHETGDTAASLGLPKAFQFSWCLFPHPLQPLLFAESSSHHNKRGTSSKWLLQEYLMGAMRHSTFATLPPGHQTPVWEQLSGEPCGGFGPKPASLGRVHCSLPRKSWPEGNRRGRGLATHATVFVFLSGRRKIRDWYL